MKFFEVSQIERLFRGDIFVRFKLYDEYEN